MVSEPNMKQTENSLKEKFLFSRRYILGIAITGLLRLVMVQSNVMPQLAYSPLSVLSVFIVFLAGWNAVREGFVLRQVAVIGGLCFIGTIWLVPILVSLYLKGIGMPSEGYLMSLAIMAGISSILNLLGYISVSLTGGWLSLKMLDKAKN